MMLAETAIAEAQQAQTSAVDEFLDPEKPRANVVGLGVGVKWTGGKPTGEPALLVLVTQKLEKSQLNPADLAPPTLNGMQTDVLAVGYPFAGDTSMPQVGIQTLAKRARPARGGYSVGHFKITAGTIATCVYDILPGGTVSPPQHGFGIPPKYYILSNNHVLANVNAGVPGDPVLQPGPFDDLDREVYWTSWVRGWRIKHNVTVGMIVKKTVRTTNFTTGRITAINATIDVNYGGGRVGRFKDQIVTTNMSAGGDSGSLVLTPDNIAVGLLFAGSPVAMIANQIENVRGLLRVEVAEQIL